MSDREEKRKENQDLYETSSSSSSKRARTSSDQELVVRNSEIQEDTNDEDGNVSENQNRNVEVNDDAVSGDVGDDFFEGLDEVRADFIEVSESLDEAKAEFIEGFDDVINERGKENANLLLEGTAYLELVSAYTRICRYKPEELVNASMNGPLLLAVNSYVSVITNIAYPNMLPPRDIKVNMIVNANQSLAVVNGPLGCIRVDTQDHARALQVDVAARFSVMKSLSWKDVDRSLSALALPKQFVLNMIIPILKNDVENVDNGIKVRVFNDRLEGFQVEFRHRAWMGGKECYALYLPPWNAFCVANGLKHKMNVEICVFRPSPDGELCFVVFKHE